MSVMSHIIELQKKHDELSLKVTDLIILSRAGILVFDDFGPNAIRLFSHGANIL